MESGIGSGQPAVAGKAFGAGGRALVEGSGWEAAGGLEEGRRRKEKESHGGQKPQVEGRGAKRRGRDKRKDRVKSSSQGMMDTEHGA